LKGAEPETVSGVVDVDSVNPLDDAFDALARLPWRTREAAGEVHVVLGLEALQFSLERPQFTLDVDGIVGHCR
jgi:hypothetical protein